MTKQVGGRMVYGLRSYAELWFRVIHENKGFYKLLQEVKIRKCHDTVKRKMLGLVYDFVTEWW